MKNDGLKGYAIASIICGVGAWFAFAIILAPLGLVFAIMSMKSQDNSTKTCATIGLIISIVVLSLYLFSMAIIAGATR